MCLDGVSTPGPGLAEGDELVRHLAATEADPLGEDSPLMALARAGALALVSRVEVNRQRRGETAFRCVGIAGGRPENSTAEGLWS